MYIGNQALVFRIRTHFLPVHRPYFHFVVSFAVQKLIRLLRSHLLIFALISLATIYVRECFAFYIRGKAKDPFLISFVKWGGR